jgi:hypothetical protein
MLKRNENAIPVLLQTDKRGTVNVEADANSRSLIRGKWSMIHPQSSLADPSMYIKRQMPTTRP